MRLERSLIELLNLSSPFSILKSKKSVITTGKPKLPIKLINSSKVNTSVLSQVSILI